MKKVRRHYAVEGIERRILLSSAALPAPAGQWHFDEGAGVTAADFSGQGNTATLDTGATWAAGNVGRGAINLNGNSTALATVNGPVVDTSLSFTASAWVKLSNLTGYQTFVSIAGTNVSGFYLQLRADTGTFAFTRLGSDATSAPATYAAAPAAPVVDSWYHLVGVADAAAGTLSLYVNGQLAGSAAYSGGWKATGDTFIGQGLFGGRKVDYVSGSIDEVALYSSALTADEIEMMDQEAAYPLDEGAGSTSADATGRGNTLMLGSGAQWVGGHIGAHALALDGAVAGIATTPLPVIDTSLPFSVSTWANLASLDGFQTFVSIDGANASGFYLQYRGDTGRFAFTRLASDTAAPSAYHADAIASPAVGTWYHLLGVNDVARGRIQLYVNGELQSTMAAPAPWRATGTTVIGGAKFNGARVDEVHGQVDNVHFYDAALSEQAAALLPYEGAANQSRIDVATQSTGADISPDFFGLFMEDINYGGEGGVYNDEVRNSGFNDSTNPLKAWQAVTANGVNATLTSDASTGPTAALTKSGKLTINGGVSASARVGIANSGFFGVAVAPSTAYSAQFYAKASAGFTGPLTVSLESNSGLVYGSATVSSVATSWAKYTVTFTTASTAPTSSDNRLVISTQSASANGATIWLGAAHLFPPSYKNSPAHLRPDLMEKLAAIKPAIFRVPGGNYLEGNTFADRFQWSKTIGRLEDRPGHFNSAWGYWSSDGMGLDEYLQMAELVGARPILAVYAGYTLNGASDTGATLSADVTDAVNELHYVLDPVTTAWGAMRAANGHAAPYDLREVEVGNEDFFSSTYGTRYPLFYDAIHAAFPALKIIATHTATGGRPYDFLDEHYYRSPASMQSSASFFDNRSRAGAKVFVGEWASMEGAPTNDLNAALGDATWLLGMMKNSDLVAMESYAPLWANVNGIQWTPDLIGYDNTRSYGSPSYYAQVMLANNHGQTVIDSSLAGGASGLRTLVTRTGDTYYLAVVNVAGTSNTSAIDLAGVSNIWPTATVTTLTGGSATATNSINDPARIVPATDTLDGFADGFAYTLPAYSLTILRFTANNTPPASVTAAVHDYATAPNTLTFTFDRDVGTQSWLNLISVTSLPTGTTLTPTAAAYDPPTRTVRYTLPTGLGDGDYRATLSKGSFLSADATLDFFSLAGDANHDRSVNFNDLVLLAQNYNTIGGKLWTDGDFTGDANVDFNDLVILAQRYNTTLPAPVAAPVPMATPVEPKPARPARPVFSLTPVAKPKAAAARAKLTVTKRR
ncbi:MAG TPA: LamG-like jellyroll fold domain-containing protein [Tepidisphaeraceae bacterium]